MMQRTDRPQAQVKSFQVLKNGDKFDKGRRIVYNEKTTKDFDSLLNDLTQTLKAPFGAVRKIYTPSEGHRVTNVDMLQSGHLYVAAGQEKFKKVGYSPAGHSPTSSTASSLSRPKRRSPNDVLRSEAAPFAGEGGGGGAALGVGSTTALGPPRHLEPHPKPLRVFIFANGNDLVPPNQLLIPGKLLELGINYVYDELSAKMGLALRGPVKKIFSLDGRRITRIDDLRKDGFYVAAGAEKFKNGSYNALTRDKDWNSSPKAAIKTKPATTRQQEMDKRGSPCSIGIVGSGVDKADSSSGKMIGSGGIAVGTGKCGISVGRKGSVGGNGKSGCGGGGMGGINGSGVGGSGVVRCAGDVSAAKRSESTSKWKLRRRQNDEMNRGLNPKTVEKKTSDPNQKTETLNYKGHRYLKRSAALNDDKCRFWAEKGKRQTSGKLTDANEGRGGGGGKRADGSHGDPEEVAFFEQNHDDSRRGNEKRSNDDDDDDARGYANGGNKRRDDAKRGIDANGGNRGKIRADEEGEAGRKWRLGGGDERRINHAAPVTSGRKSGGGGRCFINAGGDATDVNCDVRKDEDDDDDGKSESRSTSTSVGEGCSVTTESRQTPKKEMKGAWTADEEHEADDVWQSDGGENLEEPRKEFGSQQHVRQRQFVLPPIADNKKDLDKSSLDGTSSSSSSSQQPQTTTATTIGSFEPLPPIHSNDAPAEDVKVHERTAAEEEEEEEEDRKERVVGGKGRQLERVENVEGEEEELMSLAREVAQDLLRQGAEGEEEGKEKLDEGGDDDVVESADTVVEAMEMENSPHLDGREKPSPFFVSRSPEETTKEERDLSDEERLSSEMRKRSTSRRNWGEEKSEIGGKKEIEENEESSEGFVMEFEEEDGEEGDEEGEDEDELSYGGREGDDEDEECYSYESENKFEDDDDYSDDGDEADSILSKEESGGIFYASNKEEGLDEEMREEIKESKKAEEVEENEETVTEVPIDMREAEEVEEAKEGDKVEEAKEGEEVKSEDSLEKTRKDEAELTEKPPRIETDDDDDEEDSSTLRDAAATRIQAHFRGHRIRRQQRLARASEPTVDTTIDATDADDQVIDEVEEKELRPLLATIEAESTTEVAPVTASQEESEMLEKQGPKTPDEAPLTPTTAAGTAANDDSTTNEQSTERKNTLKKSETFSKIPVDSEEKAEKENGGGIERPNSMDEEIRFNLFS